MKEMAECDRETSQYERSLCEKEITV